MENTGERVANGAPAELCHAPEQRTIRPGRSELFAGRQGRSRDAEWLAARIVEGGRDVRSRTLERDRRGVRAAADGFEDDGSREAVGSGHGRAKPPEGFAPPAIVHHVGPEMEHPALGVGFEPNARIVGPTGDVARDLPEEPRRSFPARPAEAPAILKVVVEPCVIRPT
jgi:hypothetical protein